MLKKGLAFLTTVFAIALLSGCANKDYKESQAPAQSQNNTKMAEEKAQAEAEAKRQAEEARKRAEAEEAERKAKAEEARRKAEAEEAERKAKAEEARRKAEAEAERVRRQKEAEKARELNSLNEAINKIKGAKIATGQATLSSEVQENLDLIANFLKKYPNATATINSYTDATGSENINLKLSQERANNVKNYLLSKGIDENRIEAKGFGETEEYYIDPLNPDSPVNRRTEIEIN
jgi:outer membrane protein OmpA-like peptidoglycan-associated protein